MSHHSPGLRVITALFVVALIAPGFALSQIAYPTECEASADGALNARVMIATLMWISVNSDIADFAASYPITSSSSLSFGDTESVATRIGDNFFQCCDTTLSAQITGATSYDFVGTTSVLVFAADSSRTHMNAIDRGMVGICPGYDVYADSDYDVPGNDPLVVEVPFRVRDDIVQPLFEAQLNLVRSDTGSTTGTVTGAWAIYEDVNCNCVIDVGERVVARDSGRIGPNDSYANDIDFQLRGGCYVVVYTYTTLSELNLHSADCSEPLSEDSIVGDIFVVTISAN